MTDLSILASAAAPQRLDPVALFLQADIVVQAVMAGLVLAFISAHTVAAEIEDRRLAVVEVEGLPLWRRWYVVRLARKRALPATLRLVDFVTTRGAEFLPQIPGVPTSPSEG